MSRHSMPPLNQPSFLTEQDIRHLLDGMRQHPRKLDIWGHQPFTATHLGGYITALQKHNLLAEVRTVIISHAQFSGLLLDSLAQFPGIRRLKLVVNLIEGPIDLIRVPVRRVSLIDNDIEVPHRGSAYLRPSQHTRRIILHGKNLPKREIHRLRGSYPGLQILRGKRD